MKTEVYSWRLEAEKKADLEAELRRDGQRLSELLDDLTTTWLRERRNGHSNDDAEQAAIRKRAKAAIGAVAGGDPTASQRVGARSNLSKASPGDECRQPPQTG
jgi:hypothetical protein